MIGSMEQGSTSLCTSASNGYGNSTLQPKHNVFVSLSGAPKGFVEQLCVDPERWDRPPFFDRRRDSLSIGEDFPRYIFEGTEQCEVGLVVLSEELFTSKWPMLELVAMTNVKKRKRNFTTMPVLLGISLSEQLENLKRKSLPENLGDGFDRISVHHLWREFASLETKVGKFEKRRRMFEWNRYNLFEEASVTNGGCLVNVRQMFSLDKGFLELEDMNFFRFPSVTVLKINPNFPTLEQLDLRGLKHLQSLELEFIDDWVKRSEILMLITELGSLLKLGFLRWLNIPTESPCFDKISHLANLQVLDLYGCGSVPDLSNLILLQVACFRHNDFVTTIIGFNWNHINLQFLDLSCCKALQSCPGVGELISLQELSLSYCSQLKEVPNLQKLKRLRKLDVGLCSLLQGLPGLGDLVSLLELHASWCSSLAELRGIHNLINLRILDLRYCKMIKSLPGLNELVCLRSLNMSGCENLTQLPEMQKLMNLQSLELDPNAPLQSFVGLSDLISLRSLHVGIDEVHDGPDLHKLTMLKRLHITGWQGQGVSSLAELVLLESAIVRHCKGVRVLPDLHRLSRLGELDFRRCEFEDMSGMSQLTSLQTLKIRDCDKLRVLPDLRALAKLKELIVKRCVRLRDVHGILWLRNLQRFRSSRDPRLLGNLSPDLLRPRAVPVLHLSGDGFTNQQGPIVSSQLRVLVCMGCPIQELPDLANFPNLLSLDMVDCVYLTKLICSGPLSPAFRHLNVHGCMRLQVLPDLTNSENMQLVDVSNSGVVLNAQLIQDMEARWPSMELITEW